MGLAISIGNPCLGFDAEGEEHYRKQFDLLHRELAGQGVDWSPPDDPPPAGATRPHLGSFPYGYLHHLRRAYALVCDRQPVTPVSGPEDLERARSDIDEVMFSVQPHLLCHSDSAGYYVPAPMDGPLFLSDEIGGGGLVGSCQGLLRELTRVAAPIGVRLEADGSLSDAEAARLFDNGDDPFGIEQAVWLTLYETCRVSVASGHAVVYT
ncbi:hypothetical protein AB0M79_22475 [Polymorphospora sp. NPDC051019]|uniref:hypothetical protein n=1 Tax=Polymorphospora sp. NPDC051019 TaxID=3155725 RepID=UPI0034284432